MSGVVHIAGLDKLKLLRSEEVPIDVNISLVDSTMRSEAIGVERVHEHDGGEKCSVLVGQVKIPKEVK